MRCRLRLIALNDDAEHGRDKGNEYRYHRNKCIEPILVPPNSNLSLTICGDRLPLEKEARKDKCGEQDCDNTDDLNTILAQSMLAYQRYGHENSGGAKERR